MSDIMSIIRTRISKNISFRSMNFEVYEVSYSYFGVRETPFGESMSKQDRPTSRESFEALWDCFRKMIRFKQTEPSYYLFCSGKEWQTNLFFHQLMKEPNAIKMHVGFLEQFKSFW